MGFKEVTSLDADVTVALGGFNKKTKKDNPAKVEGYYLGKRTVETKKGPAELHFLQTPRGNLGVWGKTDMNRKLSAVVPGTMIRISWTGMQETPKGEMFKYKVEFDVDNTIEVSSFPNDTAAASDDSSTEGEDYSYEPAEEDNQETGDDAEYEATQNLLAAEKAAAQKAKVQEILAKGKRK